MDTNMTGRTVVILGGGIGGIVAASRLRRALPREHRVVLVERETNHFFPPSLLWMITGERTALQISRPLTQLQRRGVELVHGEIERINPMTRHVHVAGQEIAADYLIIALGAELAPESIPGLTEAGHNFYTIDGAEALSRARAGLQRGHLVVLVCGIPFKCPAAPYEAAMLLEADLRHRGVRDHVTVDLYTPEPGPMAVAGPTVSAQVRGMIEAKGIRYHPGHAVTKVDPTARMIQFANGESTVFDLLAYVPPHRAPAVVRESHLTGESGWVPANPKTLETSFPSVYAIGDVTGIPLSIGKPLPKAGVFAHGHAEVVAHNIIRDITVRGQPKEYDGNGGCFVEIGNGRAGFGSGNFYAEPAPQVALRPPSRMWHLGKLLYEKYWLFRWF
jgi:sulfide:quinone oxidoreductase